MGSVILGVVCIVFVLFDKKCYKKCSKKEKLDKIKCSKKEKLDKIKWLRLLESIVMLIVGLVYLAGDNFDLLVPLENHILNTHVTFRDLRSYLVGVSFLLALYF